MSGEFATARFQLGLATWAQETSDPNAGAGTAGAIGSWWQRSNGGSPNPCEVYLKANATDKGWVKQNFVNLNIFNVKLYGATGDGVTDDTAAINAAITAAIAAGGGTIYFPPVNINDGVSCYRITKPGSGFGSIQLSNKTNLLFLGDGYASKVAMIGSAAAGDWYAFRVFAGSTNIRFYNFHLDGSGITSPDPGDQNHFISLEGACANIDIIGMYFGPIVGDMVRSIANSPVFTEDVRMLYNLQDSDHCRSFCEAQRGTRRFRVAYNWCFGSDDNDIDFEPTGAGGSTAPTEWSVIGNQINHQSRNTDSVTTSGIDSSKPCSRNTFVHNVITNGGQIAGLNMTECMFLGNIVIVNSTQLDANILIFRVGEDCTIHGNVCASETNTGRSAIRLASNTGIAPTRCVVTDNVGNAGEATPLSFEVSDGLTCSGNIFGADNAVANTINGLTVTAVIADLDHLSSIGNMLIATNAKIGAGIDYHAAGGFSCRNTLANYNWINKVTAGVEWDRATTETFLDWRSANANTVIGGTSHTVVTVPTTVGLTIEGSAGPGDQWAWINNAAGPETLVTAPIGSACMNIAGSTADVLFYKETGAGVSGGNTGWCVDGPVQIQMGASTITNSTSARFLVPGGQGQATANANESQWLVPRSGTIRNLRVNVTVGTGAATITYTVRKNAADTTLLVALSNTAASGSDVTHSFTVAAGDPISMSVVKSASPATQQTNVQCNFELTA